MDRQFIWSFFDEMANFLRKLYANPLESAGMVLNPVFVMLSIRCMEKLLALWNPNPAVRAKED